MSEVPLRERKPGWLWWPIRSGAALAGLCAALALASMMFLMLVDVTGRYVFNSPVPGAGEMIELLLGVVVFAALPLVTAANEHIRLDYFDKILAGRLQPLVRALVDLVSGGVMGLLAWRLIARTQTIMRYGDTTPFLNVPITPVAIFISVCAAASALIFFYQALCAVRAAVTGAPVPPSAPGSA